MSIFILRRGIQYVCVVDFENIFSHVLTFLKRVYPPNNKILGKANLQDVLRKVCLTMLAALKLNFNESLDNLKLWIHFSSHRFPVMGLGCIIDFKIFVHLFASFGAALCGSQGY